MPKSPSSRRAWIEIGLYQHFGTVTEVALLTEGVDRNIISICARSVRVGRPPHGGRG